MNTTKNFQKNPAGRIKIKDIIVYPVKSMGGISLEESYAYSDGFLYDRKWMLIDKDGIFLSQRTAPDMAKFKTSLVRDGVMINFEGDQLLLPYKIIAIDKKRARIHDDMISVCVADKYYGNWFSERLNLKSDLVFMDKSAPRFVDPDYSTDNHTVDFADAFPYLLISQESLDDLNGRLNEPVPMNRFRPNIVISGTVPFGEDSMEIISAGKAQFKMAKPCGRCVITTTDQNTGLRSAEPLKTLAAFRKKEGKVLFGQNLLCLKEGKIRVGDEIIINSTKTSDI